ncbi:MAG: nucleotidyltransferase domain-containing protein [Pseudomonadota bacterium]
MDRADIIDTIAGALIDAPAFRALFLSGSLAHGLADDYSDIDFVAVTTDGANDEAAALWRSAVERTGTIVLWWDRTTRPMLINAITKDWTRTDVVILKPEQMRGQNQANLKTLFDHDGLFDTASTNTPDSRPTAARLRNQFEEFIRVFGLLHLAVGRKEYLNGVLGLYHLRNLLVGLLVEETGAPYRGGALHLNRLITEEQKALLTTLPPPIPEREALIAANLAYARAYLPRARRLAALWGVAWPDAFEAATWAHLKATLDIDRPDDLV